MELRALAGMGATAGLVAVVLTACSPSVSRNNRIHPKDTALTAVRRQQEPVSVAAADADEEQAVAQAPVSVKERSAQEGATQHYEVRADNPGAVLGSVCGIRTMEHKKFGRARVDEGRMAKCLMAARAAPERSYCMPAEFNTEAYDRIYENRFLKALDKPLSTFSIDVDAASYSNVRRFLTRNSLPPKDAVRIEEMVNYFSYEYPAPKSKDPFSITTELGTCPWDTTHKLVHVGLQGKMVALDSLPAGNFVFLLDVSGSMNSPDKLPLLKMALKMLVRNLRASDNIAIAVYAGAAGLVLPSTPGDRKEKIIDALENLQAGGSTAGGAGISLAYKTARQNLIRGGNNRVILATDGDFNVGVSSDGELVRMIEEEREHGIFLTVLGFGTGNYKDSKMEKLADKGNGNYAYIDNLLEAKKVLVSEMGGTLLTIAKDVKIQVEFNPSRVSAYRLVGYENRKLADEDFNDDTRDAGELGAGHTVTALYEIVPVGVKADLPNIDDLKYQSRKVSSGASGTRELLTVKLRYKKPDGDTSKLIVRTLDDRLEKRSSDSFRFSAAVAGFGMLLRNSEYKGSLSYAMVMSMARKARGTDSHGYRAEFVRLVERAELLSNQG